MNSILPFENTFVIIIDRIEGKYAVCEFPDETMCDIEKSIFPADIKDREKYDVTIDASGNIRVIKKHTETSNNVHRLSKKIIRFS
jgi:hypothetical protein